MRRTPRTLVPAAVALVAALMLPALAVGTAGAASSKAADQKIAETGMLDPGDLPATWTQQLRDPYSDKSTDYAAKRIKDCKKYVAFRKAALSTKHARAVSVGYAQGQSTLANVVDVFRAPGEAKAMMATFGHKSVAACVQELFSVLLRAQLASQPSTAEQVSSVNVQVAPANVGEYGDDTIAYEGNVTVQLKGGSTLTFGLGNTAVRVGRAVSDYTYSIYDASAVSALTPAVQTSIARLQAAL
jgi:hypothetical protein